MDITIIPAIKPKTAFDFVFFLLYIIAAVQASKDPATKFANSPINAVPLTNNPCNIFFISSITIPAIGPNIKAPIY